jgi:membrane-associated phospholipid phosphatase
LNQLLILRNFVFLILVAPMGAWAQDSVARQDSWIDKGVWRWKNIRAPALLIGAGLVATTDNEVFDKWEIHEVRNKFFPHFHTDLDNYIQFAPLVAVYALDAFGLKGKHNILNQTAIMIKSEVLMGSVVFALKHISSTDRPDTEIDSSFPSGHTAQAFTAATILHHEFGCEHPWVSVVGYSAATGVGILRVMNNKHWISDVLVGAGIGILSTNFIYATHQNKWRRGPKEITSRLSPFYGQHAAGLSLYFVLN